MNNTEEKTFVRKKIINFRPSVFAAVSVALGIVSAVNFVLCKIFAALVPIFFFVFFSAAYLVFYADKKRMKSAFIKVAVFALCFAAGLGGLFIQAAAYEKASLNNHYHDIRGRIAEVSSTDYGSILVLDKAETDGIKKGMLGYKIAVYVTGRLEADVGDTIGFYAVLTDRDVVYEGKFAAAYISERVKYSAMASAEEISVTGSEPSVFQIINKFMRDVMRQGLEKDTFGVGYALLLGNSDFMGEEMLADYRNAGVAHVFAVSGLHIGFFAAALGFLLKKLRVNKYVSAAVTVFCAFFYSGVSGFSSSSLRASVMCAVCFFAALWGEKYDGLSSLGIAAFIISLFNPAEFYCAGFMLSFGVAAGILILGKPFARAFSFLPRKLANALGAVLSATLTSIPISVYAFGSFSAAAIVTNLLFIPVAGAVYVALFTFTLIAGVTGFSKFFLFLPDLAIKCVNAVIGIFDFSVFVVGGVFFGGFAAFYYAALVCASGLINVKRTLKTVFTAGLALIFAAGAVCINVAYARDVKIQVCGGKNFSAAMFSFGGVNSLVVADMRAGSAGALKSFARRGVKRIDNVILLKNDAPPDAQAAATGLLTFFEVNNVYYCGEYDEIMETVTEKSFPSINCSLVPEDGLIPAAGTLKVVSDGVAAEYFADGKSVAVIGDVQSGDLETLADYYDLAVCVNAASAEYLLSPRRVVSFRYAPPFTDAESQGSVFIRL